jgi:hypothetical protein
MQDKHEIDGSESSSETRRTRALEPCPSQLDAQHGAAQAGRLERDAQAQPANAGRLEAATAGLSSSADTVSVERLRSPSQASPPSLEH